MNAIHPGVVLDGRYQLEACIGIGGTGRVHRAVHLETGRVVAIKRLRAGSGASLTDRRRLESEAALLAAISHPHIIEVLDAGGHEDAAYFVMPLLIGENLEARLQNGGRPTWLQARRWLLELCAALEHLHRQGLVHLDVKPGNCFLHRRYDSDALLMLDEHLMLVDLFSAARTGSRPAVDEAAGTPAYAAPEQFGGENVDVRADVYAVGVLAFRLLTGVLPGRGANTLAKAAPDLRFSPNLEALVARARASCPEDRHADINELVTELRLCSECDDLPVAPRRRMTTLFIVLAIAAVLGFWSWVVALGL